MSKRKAKRLRKKGDHAAAQLIEEARRAGISPEPRERSGRVQRQPAGEREADAMRTVAEGRCRREGMPPTPGNLRRVTAQDYGDPLHAAQRKGWIEPRHVGAGLRWAEQRQQAAHAWGVGRLAPICVSLEAAMVGGPLGYETRAEDPERAAALWRADRAAWQALTAAGEHARAECVSVVLMGAEVVSPDDLRAGLHRLALHFGVENA